MEGNEGIVECTELVFMEGKEMRLDEMDGC